MLGSSDDRYEEACFTDYQPGRGIGDLLDTLTTVATAVVDPVGAAVSLVAGAVASDAATAATQATPDTSATGQATTVDPSTGASVAPAAGGQCPPPQNVSTLHTVTQAQILQAATLLTSLGYATPQDPTGLSLGYRTSVCQYQQHKGITADGELGSQTYAMIVADAGAQPQPGPSPAPPSPAPTPDAPTASSDGTIMGLPWWAWALGGVAILGGGALLLSKRKKA